MPTRDSYLKIESIPGYSPVMPEDHAAPPKLYGRDCMFNPEIQRRLLDPEAGRAAAEAVEKLLSEIPIDPLTERMRALEPEYRKKKGP